MGGCWGQHHGVEVACFNADTEQASTDDADSAQEVATGHNID
ncbi:MULTISPECIES: hypothetical protein [unclassified Gordonia (in: high G+C Gram-positive bacteria)]|nr:MULTISPECIES: hypothetical protein [unclassified Gordonia (in: high G+C Gram-positive bacteria)]